MHYQKKLDKIFSNGNLWKHKTLRTLFDPNSSEYNETSMEKKLEILQKIRDNKIDLNQLLDEYKEFYINENKAHVAEIADEGYKILLKNEMK